MSSIYWITRLGAVDVLGVLMIILPLVALSLAIPYLWMVDDIDEPGKLSLKCFKYAMPIVIVGILIKVFVPSKQDALLILGVGGSVEYLMNNDKAKQLPDKCIDAIDLFMDKYLDEK